MKKSINLNIHVSFLRLFLLIVFSFTACLDLQAQRFKVEMQNDSVFFANRFTIPENIFNARRLVRCDDKNIRLHDIKKIIDTVENIIFTTKKFRKRLQLARQLEDGKISLFDFQIQPFTNGRISSNGRFYFSNKGDSVLHVLKRKNFHTVFAPSFISSYPDYEKIKKKYLRLHTSDVVSIVMVPNLITAVGFQSLGFFIPYTAAAVFVAGNAVVGRQNKFRKVRQMVKDFNNSGF